MVAFIGANQGLEGEDAKLVTSSDTGVSPQVPETVAPDPQRDETLSERLAFGRNPKGEDEGETFVRNGKSGSWYTFTVVDSFEETEVRWFASHPVGDHGEVRFSCAPDDGRFYRDDAMDESPMFMAFADHPAMRSLGNIFEKDESIKVRI